MVKPLRNSGDVRIGSIEISHRDGVALLLLAGEHDMATADKLLSSIQENADRGHGVVASLTDVEFMDSHVLHALVAGDRYLLERGRRLVLVNAGSRAVDRLLEITSIHTMITCCPGVDEAIALALTQRTGGGAEDSTASSG